MPQVKLISSYAKYQLIPGTSFLVALNMRYSPDIIITMVGREHQ